MAARAVLAATGLFLTSCASVGGGGPPGDVELLVYETESPPFCGRCESLKLSLASDGRLWIERGHWAGHYRNWRVSGTFQQATPEQTREVWASVAQFRPGQEAPAFSLACEEIAPDQGGVRVSWRSHGAMKTISYSGCDPQANGDLRRRLNAVPAILGLKDGPFI